MAGNFGYSKKKRLTPMTEMTAPATVRHVTGWRNSQREGRMMMMGVSAISVEAMPASVYCTAINEKPTPTKGPKMVVAVAMVSPLPSCRASRRGLKPLRQ